MAELPVELLNEIVSLCSQSSRVALCRVSKLFHAVTIKFLYQCIAWCESDPARIVGCSQTLISRPAAAAAVKGLLIFQRHQDRPLDDSHDELVAKALASLVNIRRLDLRLVSQKYLALLKHATFPCMISFSSNLPFEPELIHFLNRHHSIRDLDLLPVYVIDGEPLPTVELPNLKHVRGVIEILPSVLQSSPNVELVFWQGTCSALSLDQVTVHVDAIAKCGSNLRAMQLTQPTFSLDVVGVVSTRLSKLETLAIYRPRPRSTIDLAYEMETLPRMAEYLANFKSLSYLRVQYTTFCYRELGLSDLDQDFSIVSAWWAACPSLVTCVMPTSITWSLHKGNVWLPQQDTQLYREWTAEKLWSSSYSSLDLLLRASGMTPNECWATLMDKFGDTFGEEWIGKLVGHWTGLRALASAPAPQMIRGVLRRINRAEADHLPMKRVRAESSGA